MVEASTSLPGEVRNPGSPIRVFILDDHELVRLGLRELLEDEGFEVVGDTESAQEATERILLLRPDVAILDGRFPDGTGVEVCRNVRSITSAVQCLILTSYDDDQARSAAVLAGAAGYVLKEIHSTDLIIKIRRASAQETLFDPEVKAQIIKNLADPHLRDPRSAPLTHQERKVLSLIGEGLTNREISIAMFLAEKTIKNYVSSMLAKMGFQHRTQAAVYVATGGDVPRR